MTEANEGAAAGTPAAAATEVTFQHEELMQEDNISMDDLPREIKNQINGWKLLKGKYDSAVAENKPAKKTAELLSDARVLSVKIADKILTWKEDQGSNASSAPATGAPAAQAAGASTAPAAAPAADAGNAAGAPATPAAAAGTPADESDFKKIIKRDGRIRATELAKLMGKSSVEDIDDDTTFEGTKLTKSGLFFYYPV